MCFNSRYINLFLSENEKGHITSFDCFSQGASFDRLLFGSRASFGRALKVISPVLSFFI